MTTKGRATADATATATATADPFGDDNKRTGNGRCYDNGNRNGNSNGNRNGNRRSLRG
ncbi:hypothetical protein [Tunturiibacter gelidiferens]|uniref:hypothetical protein n=1 Tax=Tunturiibacter gelidiferens TaxID=3069689 RepID=UPI003D9AF742